ncbi:MAG TPA: peptide ABC transporter permease [Lachnospiraceae bacterium]|nr:peptide ABC transporter permease [Lachnospiraceae bacterium]
MKRKRLLNHKLIAGAVITAFVVLVSAAGFFYTPYDPNMMDAASKFAGISLKHPLGCDNFGRDILSRIISGSGTTLVIAFCTVLIGSVGGMLAGAVTGYFGGAADEIIMRFNDAVLAFPSILLALVFISVIGSGKYKVILALGIVFIPSFARLVRAEFIKCRSMDYVSSAKLMGASDLRIMFVHILPNTMKVMLSSVAIGFNNAVLAEAGMSFLGIGVVPPDSSLGRMLSEAQAFIFVKPSYAIFSGAMIVLMILGFSMLSEGLEAL